jgi:hypothetical protein
LPVEVEIRPEPFEGLTAEAASFYKVERLGIVSSTFRGLESSAGSIESIPVERIADEVR